jgi:hypothetical protein
MPGEKDGKIGSYLFRQPAVKLHEVCKAGLTSTSTRQSTRSHLTLVTTSVIHYRPSINSVR